jgi:hypothetical protein
MPAPRDDRVLPLTRWSSVVLVAALLAGGITLYGFPGSTPQLWAWTITPAMTPLVMGSGYLASAVFFARVALSRRWHTVEKGFFGVELFAVLLLIATVMHWDRFRHDHPVFWMWLALYVVAPVLVPTFWIRNRRRAPATTPGPRVPQPVRRLLAAVGAAELLVAATMFAVPAVAVALWPWSLTPLTARVIAGFVAANAVTLLVCWWESRWSALEAGLTTVLIGIVLIMAAVPRAAGDFRDATTMWAFVAALLVALVLTALPALTVRLGQPTGGERPAVSA